ncbi:MAG: hypothetical protein ABIP89_09340, partial [Polyangiaceae bacterium]
MRRGPALRSGLLALSIFLLAPRARADDEAPSPTARDIDDAWASMKRGKKEERRFLLMERTSVFGIRATSLRVRGSDA